MYRSMHEEDKTPDTPPDGCVNKMLSAKICGKSKVCGLELQRALLPVAMMSQIKMMVSSIKQSKRSIRTLLILYRMEECRAHAKATGASFLCCWASLVVFTGAQPATPPLGAETSIVVEAVAKLVVLTPAEDTVGGLRGLVEGVVNGFERPVVIKVYGMCGVDGLQAVVESNCWWPHLREHVVLHEIGFAVH
jgi:hypothetical protein